ncbi:MAG: VWA domain-containing protein [Selenomonadaceae bacterium]|nr:VWA domain-containing protein [Selenomonadaceae bacterium]
MANVTELVFILDKSGSMSGLESDTIGGFNSMLKKQQSEEGTAFVSTILFNNRSQVLHDRIPLDQVKPLTDDDYVVGGTTALLDAVGNAIKHIRNIHKYAREEDRPSKTLFVITTDGYENASRKFSYGDIKQLIEQQKELGWEFVFLGANIDAPQVADSIGIDRRRAVNYHADDIGTAKAFMAMNRAVSFARATPKKMSLDDDSWREDLDEDFNSRK